MRHFTLVTFLFISTFIFAQTITGKVVDDIGNIAFADVILKDIHNNIVTGTTTNDDGTFVVNVTEGKYTITVSFLGYESWKKQIAVDTNIDLEKIVLKEDSENLEEVVITSKKRVIQRKIDRLVFDVEKSVLSEGGNGTDVLKIAPRVQLQNGNLEILGKGVARVLINGRLSPLEGEDLTAFLEGLNANDIKTVEVITNPPAKYEATGNGGLINIILKKAMQDSWKNNITIAHNQNKYNSKTLRNSFSYNKKNISMSASLNATKGHHNHLEDLKINYPDNFWDIKIVSKERDDNYSGRLFLDYAASDKTTIGVQYLGNISAPGGLTNVTSTVFDNNRSLDRIIVNEGDNVMDRKSNALNFHTTTALDSLGKAISFDADYFSYNAKNNRVFDTEVFNEQGNSMGISSAALNISNQDIRNFSSTLDITLPLKKVNLSIGAKASFTDTNSKVSFFNTLSGDPILDPTRSNNFMYEEDNLAAYISGSTALSDKMELKLGARIEHTTTNGVSTEMNQENKNEYTKLFPTVYFAYAKNDNNSFNFSYGKRINRPRFSDLNPFRYYINDNSYGEGNPFLQPSFTDSFEFSHSYKRKLNTSLFVNITTDGYGVVFNSDIDNETQIVTRENYFKQYSYGIIESYMFNKISWWESQNSINLIGNHTSFVKGFEAEVKNGVQVVLSSNNTFSLSEKTKLTVNTWYRNQHSAGLFSVGEMFNMTLGLQHIFSNKMKLSVLANDIFNTNGLNNFVSVVNGVEQIYGQNSSSRNVRISLSYEFGNKKVKTKNRNFGNKEEYNRTK